MKVIEYVFYMVRSADRIQQCYIVRGVIWMNELLTVAEVAQILRVDETTVRRWVKQGALEAIVLPHMSARQSYRIKKNTLDNVLAGNLQTSASN